jgi:hypothetical protein
MQYSKLNCPTIFVDDLIESNALKTGDIILFKAYNNFNSIFHGGYFGHIGMVWIDPDDKSAEPYLFEANGIERVPLKPYHNPKGIFLTKLADRIKKYKGMIYLKQLNKPLALSTISDFKNFINYCLENMEYNYAVGSSGIKKGLSLERCTRKTNCGEIMFLSLIKLGLIDIELYDTRIFHHLNYVAKLQDLLKGYRYLDLIEIVDHPFDSEYAIEECYDANSYNKYTSHQE